MRYPLSLGSVSEHFRLHPALKTLCIRLPCLRTPYEAYSLQFIRSGPRSSTLERISVNNLPLSTTWLKATR